MKQEWRCEKLGGGGTRSDEGEEEGEENFKDERVRVTTLSGMLLSA